MLNTVMALIVPLILAGVGVYAIARKVDVFPALVSGAGDGLKVTARIVPTLVILLVGIQMLRASGALDLLCGFLTPMFSLFGIPPECAPLVLIRPFSGSGALAVGADIFATYGVDSQIGRTAAVMLGSTETTFYTIGVYFGAVGIRKTRYTIPCALLADMTGFVMASLTVRFLG